SPQGIPRRSLLEPRGSTMTTLRRLPYDLNLLGFRLREDRRDVAVRNHIVNRIRREFDEMPGMSLSVPQATRLFGIPTDVCARILTRLAEDGRLRLTRGGRYSLPSEAS